MEIKEDVEIHLCREPDQEGMEDFPLVLRFFLLKITVWRPGFGKDKSISVLCDLLIFSSCGKDLGLHKRLGSPRLVLVLSSGPVPLEGSVMDGLFQTWNRLQQKEWEEPGLQENHKFCPELGHADKRRQVNSWKRGPLRADQQKYCLWLRKFLNCEQSKR